AQRFVRQATDRLRALPGVEAVAYARGVGFVWERTGSLAVGRAGASGDRNTLHAEYHEISPGFFAALRVPLLAGREFDDADSVGRPRVAIVNERLARELWPGRAPAAVLGEPIRLDSATFQVVGVVRDYRPHPR